MNSGRVFDRLGDVAAMFRGARVRLARSSHALRKILDQVPLSEEARQKALRHYFDALGHSARLGPEQVVHVVREFDPNFDAVVVADTAPLRKARSTLEAACTVTPETLEAMLRLCRLAGQKTAYRKVLQRQGSFLAQAGDTNLLLAHLFKRQQDGTLAPEELHATIQTYLERHRFDEHAPWNRFFASLPESMLPRLHQVFSVLGRPHEAAALAEAAGELRSAVTYLSAVPGKSAAVRALEIAEKLSDANAVTVAHRRLAECLWEQNRFADAAPHFKQAGQMDRTSDCHRRHGDFAAAIAARPDISSDWLTEVRDEAGHAVRRLLTARQFADAALLLGSVENACRARSDESALAAEADRIRQLLTEVVKTGRAAFEAETRSTQAQPGAEVFKRWSQFEEAAGNLLEAGLQAELAQDYFGASLLFERAGAFGQALSALGKAAQGDEPKRRAELLEQGGDFFMAGLLYERLGTVDKAVAMFEASGEFARAADLRRKQIGDAEVVFDDRWLDLLAKAQRADSLAELCLAQARTPGRTAADRSRLFRRIKQTIERGWVSTRWMDQVAAELPSTEMAQRERFDRRAREWAAAAERFVTETYLDCFGMDLGTSNSAVALFNKRTRQAEIVEWRGRPTFPSVFAVDQSGRELAGIPEAELVGKSPRAIVTNAKRAMGSNNRFKADGKLIRAEEVSARLIDHARAIGREYLRSRMAEKILALASQELGTRPAEDWVAACLGESSQRFPLTQAVITVPAYFNDAQKQATRDAATLAGVGIKRLIHEPTAACLAQRIGNVEEETILVVDLGAGTLDLSLLKVAGGVFEVEEIEGDNALGGSDLDERLFAYFVEKLKGEPGHETIHQGLAGRRLRQACEELKIELSSHTSWTVKLPHLVGTRTVELALERAVLERLAAPWLQRIQNACRRIKCRAGRVLLIGGGALMPCVRRCVKEVFGVEPGAGKDPLTAVARGAVIQAAILAGEVKDLLVLDAVPFSLGIKSRDRDGNTKFDPLIGKHTTIPTKACRTYSTMTDNQPNVHIEVFQGENPAPEDNFKIGQFVLAGIPPAKAGVPEIEVTFDIDANCLLRVSAVDQATRGERKIEIADSHLLAPAQVASLQQNFRAARIHQERIDQLQKAAEEIASISRLPKRGDIPRLQRTFGELLRHYETNMTWYAPARSDNEIMLEIYRDRTAVESKARLALDRWDTLRPSAETWLARLAALNARSDQGASALEALRNEGDSLVQRLREGAQAISEVEGILRKWVNTLHGLPVNPEGNPEDLARHFLRLSRYEEAAAHIRRMGTATTRSQVELGLEILARQRRRQDYHQLFIEHDGLLNATKPDFVRLNESVRTFASSVVWIQQQSGNGSGFAVGPDEIATNRHVVTDPVTGKVAAPGELRVVSRHGLRRVASIHLPGTGGDDVAILTLADGAELRPLRLGFSELVEVGERIMTLGFPAPGAGGFEENLYCNAGLVNRIRPSETCSERVLEISVELQGGISGAPVLNELGEVVGLVTFVQMRAQALQSGQMHLERSFFAVPVEVLRRLRDESSAARARDHAVGEPGDVRGSNLGQGADADLRP